jgi:putative component of toxin-antitoxin plasmid stabilization module
MTGTDIYEIRVEVGSNIYRIFSCFDKGNIVVLLTGFKKRRKKHQNKKLKSNILTKKKIKWQTVTNFLPERLALPNVMS